VSITKRRTKPIDLFPTRLRDEQPETVAVTATVGGFGVTARKDGRVVAVGVPIGESAAERTVRLHESIHARHVTIGPALEAENIHPWAIQAVEDMRVQGPLWPAVKERRLVDGDPQWKHHVADSVQRDALATGLRELRGVTKAIGGDWKKAATGLPPAIYNQALTAAARDIAILKKLGWGQGKYPYINEKQFKRAWGLVPEALSTALWNAGDLVNGGKFVEAARAMDMLMVDPERDEKKRREDERAKREAEMAAKAAEEDAARDAELDKELDKMLEDVPGWRKEYKPHLGYLGRGGGSGEVILGQMKIVDLGPKVEPTKLAQGRNRRPAVSGVKMRLSRLSNAVASGRAFGLFTRKFRTQDIVGAVLFDASGSMSITMEMMLELLELAPGAVLAYYNGKYDQYTPSAKFHGILHIVARDGRLWKPKKGEKMPTAGGANDVDYEALQWLLRQKGPRVFVTDWGFCGGVPGQDVAAKVLCENSVASGAVKVIRSAAQALVEFRAQVKARDVRLR